MLLLALLGCPYVGQVTYDEEVLDLDGDGLVDVALGGLDCRDDDPTIGRCDDDGDGHDSVRVGGDDCNDADAAVNPGAQEVCNGRDDDCDGIVDEPNDSAPRWFADLDADGFGAGDPVAACTAPTGHVDREGDCDDTDPATRPNATESCDPEDRDCDGDPTADADDTTRWYLDADGDGLGEDAFVAACTAPSDQHVGLSGDCDDTDPLSTLPVPWFLDADGDGAGDELLSVVACAPPADHVAVAGDCADDDPNVSPGAVEICNGRDDDCNGRVDDTTDGTLFFPDLDGDGFGAGAAVRACVAPDGTVPNDDDCNDADPAVNPAAAEICGDSIRQDCRPFPPDDCDADGVVDDLDCAEDDPSVFPDAPERCNGLDDDCDGLVDDADPDRIATVAFYLDGDGDGFGDGAAAAELACTAPAGRVPDASDCDDALATVFPGADERCNAVDDDCDGVVDEDPVDAPIFFADADADGAGDPLVRAEGACEPPSDVGWTLVGGDCDDGRATTRPGADERCNNRDDDCDGAVDELPVDGAPFYTDGDDDGFGAGDPIQACAPGDGLVATATDCNDGNPDVYPGAPEVCGDSIRQDCSLAPLDDCDGDGTLDALDCAIENPAIFPGAPEICNGLDDDCDGDVDSQDADVDLTTTTTWFVDGDGDGVGQGDPVSACDQPPGAVLADGDCDDDDPGILPGADERCDGVDNDCDGSVDLGQVVDPPTFWRDDDGDGFGTPSFFRADGCFPPSSSWTDNALDCDDGAAQRNPVAPELCNGVDDDCDGDVDDADDDVLGEPWYTDGDGDGAGVASDVVRQCAQPAGRVGLGSGFDCADADADRFPGAPERCNGVDDDCDGIADLQDEDLVDPSSWWPDTDGDGFGDIAASPARQCTPPAGFVGNSADCADDDAARYPGAAEVCDGGFDNDCDGLADDDDPSLTPAGTPVWYVDADGDGRGGTNTIRACVQPVGRVATGDDCDDTDPLIAPGRGERCNNLDDDCDGAVDEYLDAAPVDGLPWFVDGDDDGFTAGAPILACSAPPGARAASARDDCDDTDPAIFPGAVEIWYDGIDQACDGGNDFDQDGDGRSSSAFPAAPFPVDCLDTDPNAFPGAPEVWYDGVDQACDGGDDFDLDGDGVPLASDCDDTDPLAFPGADEVWYDGVDQACDGGDDFDQDGDGDRMAPLGTDCDDTDPTTDGLPRTVGVDFPTLQAAVAASCPGTTIVLPPVLDETVAVDRPVHLVGTGTVWRPGSVSQRQLTVDADGEVTVGGVEFRDGTESFGGCVRIQSGSAAFTGTTFVDCYATQDGGALYADPGTDVFLDDVQMIGNRAADEGGAIVAPRFGQLTATDLVVRDGSAGGIGAAILLGSDTSMTIERGRILDNGPTDLAGVSVATVPQIAGFNRAVASLVDTTIRGGDVGIQLSSMDTVFTLERVRIEEAARHGAMVFQNAKLTVVDGVFAGNGVLAGGSSPGRFGGGGLLVNGADTTLTRVTFVGNGLLEGEGAALLAIASDPQMQQVLFAANGAPTDVDAVFDNPSIVPVCADCGGDDALDLQTGGSFPGQRTGDPLFRSTTGPASTWNLRLRSGSPFAPQPVVGGCTLAAGLAWCTP
jgi:hypothetical protein